MTFGALTFLNPWALIALLILPIIYWLLRFTPPKPQSVRFPPFRLLLDLINKEEEADKTPWWLVLLRLALATALIIAVAQPVLSDSKQAQLSKDPLLIVIDNDWSVANDWAKHQSVVQQAIQTAKSRGVPVVLATSSATDQAPSLKLQTADAAQTQASAIAPQSLNADHKALLKQLKKRFGKVPALQILWLSNGLANDDFVSGLKTLANSTASLTIATPPGTDLPVTLGKLSRKNGKIEINLHKPQSVDFDNLTVSLLARNGRKLAQIALPFKAGKTTAKATIALPLALRNEAARIEISGQTHAGAVRLLDDRWRRKTIGIVTAESLDLSQPLLSPLYYVTRALSPTARIIRRDDNTSTAKMLKTGLSMLVLADIGLIAPKDRDAMQNWLAKGGVLVRFAGPRLAESTGVIEQTSNDPLIPVQLRRGGRALGSALSWEQPQGLAPFASTSPLAGLKPDPSIKVRRQVLAEPTADLSGRVWASLEDGTPLITARRQGLGLVVLIHVTANSDWSNLPLSGLFVEILNSLVALAPAVTSTIGAANTISAGPGDAFVPQASLNGFGQLVPPGPAAKPVKLKDFAKLTPTLKNPAGIYRRGGAIQTLNLEINPGVLKPLATLFAGVKTTGYIPSPVRPLAGLFFVLAFLLLLADTLASLFLMGGLQRLKTRRSTASITAGIFAAFLLATTFTDPALAQSTPEISAKDRLAMEAVNQTRFAFVRTGDNKVDATSLAGLKGLNLALDQRTSVDPGEPQMIDLEKDDIVFYPLLYWPVLENASEPSDAVVTKLTSFMRNGGTIFFDTRDQNATFANLTGNVSPATIALRRILAKFDIPSLEPVPPKHVLTRAFYLMQRFPGRWLNGKLWVESSSTDKSQIDGVSSIIIGANDYASAWAIDSAGRPLYATIPGTPRQREFAYRTGINIVMYTLTGNYKADQVHVPALLERLGE